MDLRQRSIRMSGPLNRQQSRAVAPTVLGSRQKKKKKDAPPLIRNKWFKIPWIIFCFTGFAYHLYLIIEDYARYPVSSEGTVKMEQEFWIPAFSVCFYVSTVVLDQYSRNKTCHGSNGTAARKCGEDLIYNYPISEVINNMTGDLVADVLLVRFAKAREDGWDKGDKKEFLDIFYKSGFKCLRINKNQTELVAYDITSERIFNRRRISEIISYLNDEGSVYAHIFVHDPGSFPRGYDIQYLTVNLTEKFNYLAYDAIKTFYLPAPYFSRCVDYSLKRSPDELPFESRDHCIENCIQSMINQHEGYNYTDLQLTITNFTSGSPQKFLNFKKIPEPNRTVNSYNRICQSQCPVGCKTNIYAPSVISSTNLYRLNDRKRNLYGIYLIHTKPGYMIRFTPAILLLDFFIYIASVSSLWFGFVIFDSLGSIMKYSKITFNIKSNVVINRDTIEI